MYSNLKPLVSKNFEKYSLEKWQLIERRTNGQVNGQVKSKSMDSRVNNNWFDFAGR